MEAKFVARESERWSASRRRWSSWLTKQLEAKGMDRSELARHLKAARADRVAEWLQCVRSVRDVNAFEVGSVLLGPVGGVLALYAAGHIGAYIALLRELVRMENANLVCVLHVHGELLVDLDIASVQGWRSVCNSSATIKIGGVSQGVGAAQVHEVEMQARKALAFNDESYSKIIISTWEKCCRKMKNSESDEDQGLHNVTSDISDNFFGAAHAVAETRINSTYNRYIIRLLLREWRLSMFPLYEKQAQQTDFVWQHVLRCSDTKSARYYTQRFEQSGHWKREMIKQ